MKRVKYLLVAIALIFSSAIFIADFFMKLSEFSFSNFLFLLVGIVSACLMVFYFIIFLKNKITLQTDSSVKLVFWGIIAVFFGFVPCFVLGGVIEFNHCMYGCTIVMLVLFFLALIKIYKEFKKQ